MSRARIGPHHLAYLRAVADGLEVLACARTYLGIEDPREAQIAHNELSAQLRLAAKQAGERHHRLIGIRIREKTRQAPTQAKRPTLSEFIEARNLDGWSEAEQLELYEAEYPPAPQASTAYATLQRRERSRQRVVEILRRLEVDGRTTAQPRPTDEVDAWFADHLAQRLVRAGYVNLQQLADRVRQGGQWYSGITAVGRTKAVHIAQQLEAILPGSTRRRSMGFAAPTQALIGLPESRTKALVDRPENRAQIRPGNQPESPSGNGLLPPSSDLNTAWRADNIGAIGTDPQALATWAEACAGSQATRKSYLREGRRLLLWMQIERAGRRLLDFKLDDAQAYRTFLAYVPDGWISRAKASPAQEGWTPFKGQLSAASQRQAMTILASWFDWLCNAEYLRANPWKLVKKTGQSMASTQDSRALDTKAISLKAMGEIGAFIERQAPSPARARARFVVAFLSTTGLRSAELLAAKISDIRVEPEGVFLRVVGKGKKARDVMLVDVALNVLDDYLASRGLESLDVAPGNAPVLASLADPMKPVSYQTLYKTTRAWLSRAVTTSALSAAEQSRLQGASTHWLRHTFGTTSVALGTPYDVVQQQLGHSRIDTTMSIYSRAPLQRRAAELQRAWAKVTE
ncbi:site-specific integrase [Hydrogenophaga sp. BPS33]|uniref:site-specific integrase n=1 Tax=Hydrogenophaga sp. BPS33 TaxID=2651974 RepID=UPI00131F7F00|nr:site-specific integrase [Hydrogenophaga sp. BPS33]QHE89101.1 tyrosine-type recombinase/integrase [Hydrogenophaga sp. BPS33]